jgi:CO/xanthine dehydrogenase FAD-binding subunit
MDKNEASVWRVGVDASLQAVFEDPACPAPLRQALVGPLSWQARNETSVGKVLKSTRLASEWTAALLALGSTIVFENGEESPLESLLQKEAAGEPAELRVSSDGKRWGAARMARTLADDPIVAAAAGVAFQGNVVTAARLALVGVWSETVRLAQAAERLVGGTLDEAKIDAVAQAVMEEVAPAADYLGSEGYRREMAGVMSGRALRACLTEEAVI